MSVGLWPVVWPCGGGGEEIFAQLVLASGSLKLRSFSVTIVLSGSSLGGAATELTYYP